MGGQPLAIQLIFLAGVWPALPQATGSGVAIHRSQPRPGGRVEGW